MAWGRKKPVAQVVASVRDLQSGEFCMDIFSGGEFGGCVLYCNKVARFGLPESCYSFVIQARAESDYFGSFDHYPCGRITF